MNSKRKGKSGELEFCKFLATHGIDARRSQQYKGTAESADIDCPTLDYLHFEVKRVERLNIHDAMAQALKDAGHKMPVVAHRKNRTDWLLTLRADDFLKLIGQSYDVN